MTNPNETIKDRLLQFLAAKKITKSEFGRLMGLSVAYVSAMRKSIPEEKVMKMCEIFPDLNRDWLLYGEGEMLKSHSVREHNTGRGNYMVPLLPVEAMAGNLQDYSRGVSLDECKLIPSPVRGAELAIQISGDSMEPEIHNGTIAVITRINDSAFIAWGNPMVIDTENGVLIKMVYPSEKDESYIEARSYNPRYPAIQIPKSSIFGLYRIMGYIRFAGNM